MTYLYLVLILMLIYICYLGITFSIKAPLKIKLLSIISLILLFIQALVLGYVYFAENIQYLYLLKPLIYLNFISMPIIVITILLILLRNNKTNFSYLFIILFILIGTYFAFIGKINTNIILDINFGYIFKILNNNLIQLIMLIFYTIILFCAVNILKKKGINKFLLICTLMISVISILEILINGINRMIVPNLLISHCLWIILFDFILKEVGNKKDKLNIKIKHNKKGI